MRKDLIIKVKELVEEAAQIVSKPKESQVSQKGEKDFVTEIDLKISDLLCRKLPEILENSVVISEEGYKERPKEGYCWIIDPIDGTNNLIFDFPNYAISVGLLENRIPVLGVVYNPKTREMFWAEKGKGAYCNGERITVCSDAAVENTLVLAETNPYCNRSENQFHDIMDAMFCDCIDYRITGSAALDCCYIACGRGGAFVAQNLKPWDYAAGIVILEEAGGCLTLWDGSRPRFYGDSAVVATNGLVHQKVLDRLKRFL